MNSAIERLLSLRVGDVMQREVVEVPATADMVSASEILLRHGISGAPIVDYTGRCIGILSAGDFMKKSCRCGRARQLHDVASDTPSNGRATNGERTECATKQGQVTQYMSSNIRSTTAEQTLLDAARQMCDSHVHRLPVLDRTGRAVGFISSLDIVAALVTAIEE